MAHNHSRSVAELRRESERTRAELSQTVEVLRDKITDTATDIRQRVSPEHIKAEVSGYVADTSRHWLATLKEQAMENPMQALAAGIAIAVPAFKIIRSVPPPLLMIGAGLVLASPRVRGAVSDKVSESLKTSDGGNIIDETAEMAREKLQSARVRAEGAIQDAQNAVSTTAAEVREAASEMASDASQRAAELGGAARQSLSSAKEALGSKVNAASGAATEAFDRTKAKVTETAATARASAERMVGDNAALVGGLGLAIGALIAASLPSTRAERQTFGEASDTLRETVADAASDKFEETKAAAMSAADSAAAKISEAAVGSQTSRAREEAADKLKTVTDEAVTTAFEPSQTDHR